MSTPKLKSLPPSERPRERLLASGPSALATSELLAVILGSGTKDKSVHALAQELLISFDSLTGLVQASVERLCQIKGLGKAKAIQLKAALYLSLRLHQENAILLNEINSPLKAYLWVRPFLALEKREVFGVILLDARGAPLRWHTVSVGILNQTLVHPREVFHPAVQHLAASLILVHNHPSGDATPSSHDFELTRKLIMASQAMSVPILDHIIIGKSTFQSLREKGLCFDSNDEPYALFENRDVKSLAEVP